MLIRVKFLHKEGTPQDEIPYMLDKSDFDETKHRLVEDQSWHEQPSTNITEYSSKDAIALIAGADFAQLAEWEAQESASSKDRPRVRAALLERRANLQPAE